MIAGALAGEQPSPAGPAGDLRSGGGYERVLVLGASGRVGRCILSLGLERGLKITAQTRSAAKLQALADRLRIAEASPTDARALGELATGQDAAIMALGVDSIRPTTLFSDATRALLPAMSQASVRRLIAITGVGAGETRGHGGFLYDWLVFPLFTRARYRDKDHQEALIAASDLDWTIVRPAPFSARPAATPFEVHTEVAPELTLRSISIDEVAAFVLDELAQGRFIRQRPFIGHP